MTRKYTAELAEGTGDEWNVYRTVKVNGEVERVYVGTIIALDEGEAVSMAPGLDRDTASAAPFRNR